VRSTPLLGSAVAPWVFSLEQLKINSVKESNEKISKNGFAEFGMAWHC
jgi:hypothetical protein